MVKRKLTVGVLCGGQSAEHEVSITSAKNIIAALDKRRYQVLLIMVDRQGRWRLQKNPSLFGRGGQPVVLLPGGQGRLLQYQESKIIKIDVIFPIIHGPCGEDGSLQGLLKLAGVPFVGAGVLGSSVGMDKDVMKRLLAQAGLPVGKFLVVKAGENRPSFVSVKKFLGAPFFVKPANLGSSVGISKVNNQAEYTIAAKKALSYDRKILLEEYIKGREIECSVLGNDRLRVSLPGEIKPRHDFYSYQAKYLDKSGADLIAPAKLTNKQVKTAQLLAVRVFQVLDCAGLGRVDFFLRDDGQFLINEINTLPGFTAISMYPRLWAVGGLAIEDLLNELIGLALEKFQQEQKVLNRLKH